ncbi:MAG: molybdopterin oxidoreductase family protein [Geobacteraceae bacterium]|nr:molybdopterin oxidoreductase family protein [Geobacteraceae bacterium]
MPITTHRSVCPYDCPDTCGLLVDVENGRAVKVSGDPDHPYTRGLLCGKMQHYEKTVHSERRLLTPLLRSGAKGSGEFVPISWDEAVKRITDKWKEIIASFGAEAILPYSYAGTMGVVQRNSGHPFFHRLGASRLDRTICSPAKGAGWKAVMGDTPTVDPDEVLESDLIILWGINAAATSIHFMQRVNEAKKRGAKVWLIDTYRTPTAAVADRVFLIRPGSDGALALALMNYLSRNGLVDSDYISEKVLGFDQFNSEILPQWTTQAASGITGIAAEDIESMARSYAAAKAPFIRLGSGLSRYGNGAMTVRTIACLPALVGAYGKLGAGCFPDTSTGTAFAMGRVTREDLMPAPTRIINMNRLGEALNRLDSPPVKSLYVYHSNPAAITPDQNSVIAGLLRDDLFTVVHERFMTDTAKYADLVLPATSSLEHSDIYRAYGTYCIQRVKGIIPPIGQSRPNKEVFSLLAEAMGFEEDIFRQSCDGFIDQLLLVPSPLREGTDSTRLEENRAVRLQVNTGLGSFLTPSGRIEILNSAEKEPLPRFLPTHEESSDLPLCLMTAPSLHSLNASFYERDDLRAKQEKMYLLMNPYDAADRNLVDGEMVTAWNSLGEVPFFLKVSEGVQRGVAVAEGVWWLEFAPGERSVNALVSQRLTDQGGGSTFYDNRIDVRKR